MRMNPDELGGLLRPLAAKPRPRQPTSRERAQANRLRVLQTVAQHGHPGARRRLRAAQTPAAMPRPPPVDEDAAAALLKALDDEADEEDAYTLPAGAVDAERQH